VAVAGGVWLLLEVVPDHTWKSVTISAGWLRAIGLTVLVAATAFTLWARVALGRMWSSAVLLREDHELRSSGPYAITRHPIYTGILGMLIGSALLSGGRWIVVVLVAIVYVLAKVRAEERLLTALFAGEYERYRERVPQLIPYPKRR
jgi:protein-S-isoprenylcysteine O-methyltransferase Ste14